VSLFTVQRTSFSTADKLKKTEITFMSGTAIISIVDDDDSHRRSLDNLIRSVGFGVQGFSSAKAFLSSNQLLATACLIVDVRMPAMSGLELQRQLAATGCRIPIIFVTSHADKDARARALAAGAVEFLYKPFPEEALLNAIQTVLKTGGK
jgi:FixJ family two-component response regulator